MICQSLFMVTWCSHTLTMALGQVARMQALADPVSTPSLASADSEFGQDGGSGG